MKASSVVFALLFLTSLKADDALDKARQIEKSGDVSGARAVLAAAVQHSPGDVDALTEYAEFLLRYGDPDSRAAYTKTFEAIERSGDRAKLAAVARELTILDLIAGDRSDRKSTRLNSSHSQISYAVFCLKKKNKYTTST